jgi:hypothetical protein
VPISQARPNHNSINNQSKPLDKIVDTTEDPSEGEIDIMDSVLGDEEDPKVISKQ